MSGPIRVAVLNDYELIVAGLATMFEPYPDRVVVVDRSVRDATVATPVDLALFDTYGRPDFAEQEIADLVADPLVGKVVVFTNSMPPAEVNRLLAMGVAGCLSKSSGAADLVAELERIMAGEQRVSSFEELAEPRVEALQPGAEWELSYRESEVLALLSQGLRNKEIAAALYIGTETVKTHLTSVYRKMGVSSRAEAIAAAVRSAGFGRFLADAP